MNPLPKSIRYNGFTYDIRTAKAYEIDPNDPEAEGTVDFTTHTILIEEGIPLETQWETLFHELMHIAFKHTIALPEETEEQIVEPLSCNLYGILRENNLM